MDRRAIEHLEDEHFRAQAEFEAFEWALQDARAEVQRHTKALADYISYAARESGDMTFSNHLDRLGENLEVFEKDIWRKRDRLEEYREQEMREYRKAMDW